MRSTSVRFSAIPASSAGLKSEILTLSNGGIPPYGPSHLGVNGFASGAAARLVSFCEAVINRSVAAHTTNANLAKLKLNMLFSGSPRGILDFNALRRVGQIVSQRTRRRKGSR